MRTLTAGLVSRSRSFNMDFFNDFLSYEYHVHIRLTYMGIIVRANPFGLYFYNRTIFKKNIP